MVRLVLQKALVEVGQRRRAVAQGRMRPARAAGRVVHVERPGRPGPRVKSACWPRVQSPQGRMSPTAATVQVGVGPGTAASRRSRWKPAAVGAGPPALAVSTPAAGATPALPAVLTVKIVAVLGMKMLPGGLQVRPR